MCELSACQWIALRDAPAGVAHLQSQVENLRHRIQTHTRSVEFDA